MDLKNYLMNTENTKKKLVEKKQSKKNISINIFNPNKHLSNIFKQLDDEMNRICYNSWNRLEKGIKYNKLIEYIESFPSKKSNFDINKEFITDMYKNGYLNKLSDVNYDSENAKIISINNITYDKDTMLFFKIM